MSSSEWTFVSSHVEKQKQEQIDTIKSKVDEIDTKVEQLESVKTKELTTIKQSVIEAETKITSVINDVQKTSESIEQIKTEKKNDEKKLDTLIALLERLNQKMGDIDLVKNQHQKLDIQLQTAIDNQWNIIKGIRTLRLNQENIIKALVKDGVVPANATNNTNNTNTNVNTSHTLSSPLYPSLYGSPFVALRNRNWAIRTGTASKFVPEHTTDLDSDLHI